MDLLPTEEQQQIIDTAASFLANEFPIARLLGATGGTQYFSRVQLQQIAALGWLGIGLPDEFDGVGYGLTEEALLFAELGRNLMSPSLLGSALGARIAALSRASETLHAILSGESRVAVATPRPAVTSLIGDLVTGEFLVFEDRDADLVLLADESGAALLPLHSLECTGTESCIDETLPLSSYKANDSSALCYLSTDKEPVFLRGALLVSAMQLGIAEATLERSVHYAKEREQFGKPIGTFQSIKHYCAEMAIRCESARAMLYHASITLQGQSPAGLFDTYSLKALAADAAQTNANVAVQIHGGMGYTKEMDIHLFVKRSQILGTLFGSERLHLKKLLSEPAPHGEMTRP